MSLGMFSCTAVDSVKELAEDDVEKVEIKIADMLCDSPESRMNVTANVKYMWQANDTIGIFPTVGGQVEFPITLAEGEETDVATFTGGGWALKGGYEYMAYFPYDFYNRKSTDVKFSFIGQNQIGHDNRMHLSNFVPLVAGPTKVTNGAINFILYNQETLFRLDLTLPEATTYETIKLYTENKLSLPVEKSYDILTSKVEKVGNTVNVSIEEECLAYATNLNVGLDVTTTTKNQTVRVWITFPYVDLGTETLKVEAMDKNGFVYFGEVKNNADGSALQLSLKRNRAYPLKANLESRSGVQASIENWGEDEEIFGEAD